MCLHNSGAKVLLFSDICKHKLLFYLHKLQKTAVGRGRKERASLLGGEAGWRSDRSSYRESERETGKSGRSPFGARSMLFYLLALEGVGLVAIFDIDMTIVENLVCSADLLRFRNLLNGSTSVCTVDFIDKHSTVFTYFTCKY